LAAVRVPRKNPAFVALPARQIDRIRVMTENQRRSARVELPERGVEIEAMAPHIVEPRDLKPVDVVHVVAEDFDAEICNSVDEPFGDFRMRPIHSVIVISENRNRRKASSREKAVDVLYLIEGARMVGEEIACYDDDIRRHRCNTAKRREHVLIVYLRPDMDVAQLHERSTCKRWRQMANLELALDDLQSVRFDAPRIEKGTTRCADGTSREPNEVAASHLE